jgi:thiamine pyrophosphokinase
VKYLSEKVDLLIGVDGGTKVLKDLSLVPDVLVGDFDSLDRNILLYFKNLGVEIREFPAEKDEIDSELASMVAQEYGATVQIFTGVIGDRIDHSIGVIQLMFMLKSSGLTPYIVEEKFEIGILKNENLVFKCSKDELWSILPLNGDVCGLTLEGFKYSLRKAKMPFGKPFGISNETIEDTVKIDIENGCIIFIRWRERPC